MTFDEAKNLKHGQILLHKFNKNADGTPQRWRVNGKVKITKTGIRIPVKYGLRFCDYVTEKELELVEIQK